MAFVPDGGVSFLLENLSTLVLEEANRTFNLREHIESMEKELLLMRPLMDSVQTMAEHDQIAAKWLEETHSFILRAKDLTTWYKRRLAKKTLKFLYLKEMHELALELEKVTLAIRDCSQKGIKVLNDRNLNPGFSSDQQAEGKISDSALNKLSEFIGQNRNLPYNLLESLVAVRDKMAPFDKFLQGVEEAEAELDERQKLWVQEIKDIFHLLEQSLLTFQCSLEKEKETKCQESFSILLLMSGSLRRYEKDLKEKMTEIESRIDTVTSRYELCAIGGFRAKNSSRVIVPQMRSHKNVEPVKSSSMRKTPLGIFLSPVIISRYLLKAFSVHFDKKPSMSALEMDLKLMKALLEDASKMEESDKRLKVWIEQVREIYHGLRTLDSNIKETIQSKRGLGKIVSLHKITQDTKEIEEKIDDALVRKMRYDIGSFVARNGNVEEEQFPSMIEVGCSAQSTPNVKKLEEQVQLMKELQLIDALLEDVSTMDKLDVRLEVWLQEILGVAQEAREIVQQDFGGIFFESCNVSMKMSKIRKRMDDICEWKKNYIIQGIKATNGSTRMSHNLEAAEAYPSGDFAAEFESLKREVKLMKALETDIQEIVGLGGKLKAWSEEMHGVIVDVDKFIEKHGEITRRRGIDMACITAIQDIPILNRHSHRIVYFKGKIQALHERRMRYGIESIKTTSTNAEEPQVIISGSAESSEMVSERERLLLMLLNEPAAVATSRPESSITITTGNHEKVPLYLWRCLFYFSLFPVGKEIPARRLIAVWIAEGIVAPRRGENKQAEYICCLRLAELIERRLIEVTRRKLNGKAKAFKLCNTNNMTETLSRMAKAANFFQDASNMTFRLAHYDDINTSCNEHINGSKPCSSSLLKSHYKRVVSFFSFDTTEGRKHGEKLGNFLHRCIANGCFKSMRVLDLERVFKPKLPSALGALTGLRYLGLRWTYLEHLPDRVSKLLNLQVLDVKRTYISTLPKSIWSMQYLRHLYLSETYRSRFVSRPRNIKPLSNLLTLWGAFIDEDSPVVNGLDTILNVRKLGLTCRSMSSSTEDMKSQLEAVGDWIINLEHLEDLRIKSFDDLNKPSDLYLKPFSGHKNLSTVYLVGRLRYPTIVSEFPATITDITLSGSELENDPMAALQSLPNLIILRLLAASTKRSKMKCKQGGFPNLQYLKLWSLENWDEWQLEEGALASLMDLEIRNCHKLKMIPNEITHLRDLSAFRLSRQFKKEIKKNQSNLWNEIKRVYIRDEE